MIINKIGQKLKCTFGFTGYNPVVFESIYTTEWPKVLGFILKNSGRVDDAEDVFSETILIVFEKIVKGNYQSQGKFSGFFFSIAKKKWFERLRKSKNGIQLVELKDQDINSAEGDWDDLYAKIKDEKLNAMHRAMQRLGGNCREMIRKFHLESVSLEAIATTLNLTYGYVRRKITECRKKLKALSEEEFKKSTQF